MRYENYNFSMIKDGAKLNKYIGNNTKVDIPSEINGRPVVEIGWFAFNKHQEIKYVTIPNSVKRIDMYAFNNCENLRKVTMPDTATYIREGAFSWCTSLKAITIPRGIKIIDKNTFCQCNNLKNISIPDGVKRIEELAFFNNYNLKNLTIPNSVSYIGDGAFENCTNLKNLTMSTNIKLISYAFENCPSLSPKDIDYIYSKYPYYFETESPMQRDMLVEAGYDNYVKNDRGYIFKVANSDKGKVEQLLAVNNKKMCI